jgi:hypothetical protein
VATVELHSVNQTARWISGQDAAEVEVPVLGEAAAEHSPNGQHEEGPHHQQGNQRRHRQGEKTSHGQVPVIG